MAATPNVMKAQKAQLAKAAPQKAAITPQQIKQSVSYGPPKPIAPAVINVGGNQSVTPGSLVFTEYQAQVFNQTEAMYKTTGFLGISLFEDSYGLSKSTAAYVVNNIPLAGTLAQLNTFAQQTYNGVLGIADPTPPPPPPPVPNTKPTTSPVNPTKGNPTNVSAAVTPTKFTPPTSVSQITSNPASVTPSNTPTSLTAITQAGNNPSVYTPNPTVGTGGMTPGGGKIICNELYRQGYLSEQMWDADERYGEMMFEQDPKLVIGYQMWARRVVKFMKENPNNTKMAYWVFKPWTEYMGYKMGVVEKPTLRGRFTNWIGTQFSYAVFNLYNGKRLLDKYNYKVFKSENNIGEYKIA